MEFIHSGAMFGKGQQPKGGLQGQRSFDHALLRTPYRFRWSRTETLQNNNTRTLWCSHPIHSVQRLGGKKWLQKDLHCQGTIIHVNCRNNPYQILLLNLPSIQPRDFIIFRLGHTFRSTLTSIHHEIVWHPKVTPVIRFSESGSAWPRHIRVTYTPWMRRYSSEFFCWNSKDCVECWYNESFMVAWSQKFQPWPWRTESWLHNRSFAYRLKHLMPSYLPHSPEHPTPSSVFVHLPRYHTRRKG